MVCVLIDKREQPIFPRWFGYFNIWAATMFTPGSFNVFFHTGPLAWNGVFAFYIPVAVFAVWCVVVRQRINSASSVPGGRLKRTVTLIIVTSIGQWR